MIGINNRNLQTLQMDNTNVERLFPLVPKDITVVAESGFSTHAEMMKLTSLGIHIFLVGTSILKSPDMAQKIRELKGKVS
jgi:indole-3-glycerol phosphate synthase